MDSLTDREIMKASDAIDKALASSNRSNRGEVSVRILSLVRNLNDNIAEKIWCDLHPDKPRSVNKVGKEFINVPSYRFIGKFYNYLGKSVSHFTPTEDGAERLMLKYYQYVLQLKEVMSVRYNTEILKNINLFILDTDQKTQDYYNKVAEQIVHIDDTAISSSADNYYVNRVKPFVSNNKVYYEITLEPALGKPNKFNRITAFTKYNIFSNYSVALKFVDTYINIFGVNFPIKIISDWSVSIRPCEINNFAAILNMNVNIQRGNIEYRVMMEYLKEHQVSLVEIVDYGQEQYMKLKNEVIFSTPARHSYFFDILDQCRLYSKKRRPGKNILRLLLNRMNNEIIKDQWPYKNGKTYVDLYLSSKCMPFDKNPFSFHPKGHVMNLSELYECIDPKGHTGEIISRYVENNAYNNGQLFTPVENLSKIGNENKIKKIISKYNDSLWEGFCPDAEIGIYKDYVFNKGQEIGIVQIINCLLERTTLEFPLKNCFADNLIENLKAFYNMSNHTVGLVGMWDCVAFDEVAGIKFKDKDGIQIMKGYMASGAFSRGKAEIQAKASMVFVGNINQSVDTLLKTSSLFDPFPPEMGTDTAFLDRMHCYIPGWEIPKYRPASFTNDYGFITDYLSEFMRELRKDSYSDLMDKYYKDQAES